MEKRKKMKVIEITKENYEEEVEKSDQKVLIDFYADWCGPCKMMMPVIEELSDEMDHIKFVRINVDQNEEISRSFGVMSIPTFVVMEKGNVLNKMIGMTPKEEIKKMLN